MVETTFAIIKPDAVAAGHTQAIIDMIKDNGFIILDQQSMVMSDAQARRLYDVHKARSFFGEMLEFITSGPVVLLALQRENAVKAWRDLMGATNPAEAAQGTVRKLYGTSIGNNAAHGSDSVENARQELGIFFPELAFLICISE